MYSDSYFKGSSRRHTDEDNDSPALVINSASYETVPLTTIVPFNQLSSAFQVVGIAKGAADMFATSGEQSGAVSTIIAVH